ncbi:MAG TPA: hypothetical protein PLD25_30105 [Chloroflexota bacterium]|nr:hypothetical protein [Chloroflexota bacterium]HUM67737.1 hypothetical protein [Chloroflexota bacterium]
MPISRLPIETRLTHYLTGLTNARDVPELQSRVALYGYNPTKLDDMLTQRQAAFDSYLAQKTEYNEQHIATFNFEQAWAAAHTPYIRLVKLGRILFKDDYATTVKLTLNEERKKSFSGWLAQARKFYTNLLDDTAALATYAQYNTPLADINAALALVNTAEQANITQAKEKGEAQQATKDRDALLDALDADMSKFYALSKLACEDAPQLVEMLEIVVDSSGE